MTYLVHQIITEMDYHQVVSQVAVSKFSFHLHALFPAWECDGTYAHYTIYARTREGGRGVLFSFSSCLLPFVYYHFSMKLYDDSIFDLGHTVLVSSRSQKADQLK